jgi:hypothetical protein
MICSKTKSRNSTAYHGARPLELKAPKSIPPEISKFVCFDTRFLSRSRVFERAVQSADKITNADLFINASSFERIPIKLTNGLIKPDPHPFK